MTLEGNGKAPTYAESLGGAVFQIGVFVWVWLAKTSAGECAWHPSTATCLGDPWTRQVIITLVVTTLVWLVSLRTIPRMGKSDTSIVDQLWNLVPWVYAWHWYFSVASPRLLLMASVSTIWGARLTWNFFIKGGFSGGEDHRWKEIHKWPVFNTFLGWEIFNLVLVCFYQQLLILGFASPAAAVMGSAEPLNALDAVAAVLFLLLILGEAVADRQMYVYQTEKYRRIRANEPAGEYARGFIETGLWAYSRHPNYFCEVTMWWAYYLFSVAAGLPLINWTLPGPLFLTLLFVAPHASIELTEMLSSRKYKDYPEYQKRVSCLIPLPPHAKR
eukprot:NODE_1150_length_1230_cov_327.306383.p1 GENE.NODE_1150_length_1230_cov_327.306383~~NODE_1150_length_1230_cov_327.306383.p1  ORF type:complete len:330 (-),score=77.58 NODE_1150_length_1230_cov_327.306383:189-1178(-)